MLMVAGGVGKFDNLGLLPASSECQVFQTYGILALAWFLHSGCIDQLAKRHGGRKAMVEREDILARAMLAAIPATIVALGVGLSLLPRGTASELLTLLLAWTSLSLPLGIALGHCVPYEEP